MARYPTFQHIHCSSRFDRSAESLESDLDNWMSRSNLITLTEVNSDRRAAQMREKGWDHYNAKRGGGADNSGICWDRDVWRGSFRSSRKLHNHRFVWAQRGTLSPLYVHAATVMLTHQDSGHKLLVSCAHMVSGIDAAGAGFSHADQGWATRKRAFIESNQNWSRWIDALDRTKRPDGIMVVADWNIDLKDNWFREFLHDHWGKNYRQTWKHLPAEGSMGPGRGRIIDATLAKDLKIIEGAEIMPVVRSSDHRPYKERLGFGTKAEVDHEHRHDGDKPEGDTKPGRAWWGFGDYGDEDKYVLDRETGEAGGEVL